jgi:phosphatidylserine/phosphatidylglycerophosphate/cardiolipin synthase-like enzyme/uncharacterized membrane protein YdjX (TVP38/TMEM64 family)
MILKPDDNVWRVAKAARAALLVDGADYFAALRRAMIKARRSILIAGWDIHSQTRLVGHSGEPEDGYPAELAKFLAALVTEKPALDVCLLLWDFSVLYAAERDPFPTVTLNWNTPSRIRFCLDDCVPIGSSQHQKLVVIDDALAFSGGLDITVRRWDTREHPIDDPNRVDPSGKPYKPFHDVQMMIDGAAAQALGALMRGRWSCAAGEDLPRVRVDSDPWPEHVEPHFTEVDIGIARTQPRYEAQRQVREVEQLFLDCIDVAERSIYIENQFLTAPGIAERIARRLRERPKLEVLIVSPESHDSWLEAQSMRAGRIGFAATLRDAGGERVHLVYPQVADSERNSAVMVHAKVMIVDDAILRVGSANLNNRSMGTDTECDLVIIAQDENQRRRIAELRNGLLGHHCGATAEQVADALAKNGGSLIAVARALRNDGHSLEPIVDAGESSTELAALIQGVADPERPIGAEEFVGTLFGHNVSSRHVATIAKVIGAGLLVVALALVWQYAPLAKPAAVRAALASISGNQLAPLIVIGAFVAAGFVMFPVTVLIAATAAAFGPWYGFAYAAMGALASAVATYALGAAIGKRTLRDFIGSRLNRIRQRVVKRGVITIAALRIVPVAPFTVVNLVAGASAIPVFDYVAGTLLGMLPGLAMISAVGHQFARILTSPTSSDIAWLAAAVVGWIVLSIGVQALVSRYWSGGR